MGLVSLTRWLCGLAGVGLCLWGSVVLAQSPVASADPLANSALPAPHLAKDRANLQRFQAVSKAVAAEDLVTTQALVRRLFELPEDRWFGDGSQGRGMRRELTRQLASLPQNL